MDTCTLLKIVTHIDPLPHLILFSCKLDLYLIITPLTPYAVLVFA